MKISWKIWVKWLLFKEIWYAQVDVAELKKTQIKQVWFLPGNN